MSGESPQTMSIRNVLHDGEVNDTALGQYYLQRLQEAPRPALNHIESPVNPPAGDNGDMVVNAAREQCDSKQASTPISYCCEQCHRSFRRQEHLDRHRGRHEVLPGSTRAIPERRTQARAPDGATRGPAMVSPAPNDGDEPDQDEPDQDEPDQDEPDQDKEAFQCFCNTRFRSLFQLQNHARRVHAGSEECDACGQPFPTLDGVKKHFEEYPHSTCTRRGWSRQLRSIMAELRFSGVSWPDVASILGKEAHYCQRVRKGGALDCIGCSAHFYNQRVPRALENLEIHWSRFHQDRGKLTHAKCARCKQILQKETIALHTCLPKRTLDLSDKQAVQTYIGIQLTYAHLNKVKGDLNKLRHGIDPISGKLTPKMKHDFAKHIIQLTTPDKKDCKDQKDLLAKLTKSNAYKELTRVLKLRIKRSTEVIEIHSGNPDIYNAYIAGKLTRKFLEECVSLDEASRGGMAPSPSNTTNQSGGPTNVPPSGLSRSAASEFPDNGDTEETREGFSTPLPRDAGLASANTRPAQHERKRKASTAVRRPSKRQNPRQPFEQPAVVIRLARPQSTVSASGADRGASSPVITHDTFPSPAAFNQFHRDALLAHEHHLGERDRCLKAFQTLQEHDLDGEDMLLRIGNLGREKVTRESLVDDYQSAARIWNELEELMANIREREEKLAREGR